MPENFAHGLRDAPHFAYIQQCSRPAIYEAEDWHRMPQLSLDSCLNTPGKIDIDLGINFRLFFLGRSFIFFIRVGLVDCCIGS